MSKIYECNHCKNTFIRKHHNKIYQNVFCSRDCFLKNKTKKNDLNCTSCGMLYTPKTLQKKQSIKNTCEDCRQKIDLKCPVCNSDFKLLKSRLKKRKNPCCSVKCKSELQKKDWNNLTRNNLKQKWISEFGIESFKCNRCGHDKVYNIVLHHIIYVKNGGRNNPENLEPLCLNCHGEEHYNKQ